MSYQRVYLTGTARLCITCGAFILDDDKAEARHEALHTEAADIAGTVAALRSLLPR